MSQLAMLSDLALRLHANPRHQFSLGKFSQGRFNLGILTTAVALQRPFCTRLKIKKAQAVLHQPTKRLRKLAPRELALRPFAQQPALPRIDIDDGTIDIKKSSNT